MGGEARATNTPWPWSQGLLPDWSSRAWTQCISSVPYLGLVPFLSLLKVLGSYAFVLLPDVAQGSGEVRLGDIHIDLDMLLLNLGLKLMDLLRNSKKNRQQVSHVEDGNSFPHVHSWKATPLTSSWSFFKKAISSCKDSTLRSRSRRAKEALSTSYFKEERWDMKHAKVYGLSNLFILINHMSLLSSS